MNNDILDILKSLSAASEQANNDRVRLMDVLADVVRCFDDRAATRNEIEQRIMDTIGDGLVSMVRK